MIIKILYYFRFVGFKKTILIILLKLSSFILPRNIKRKNYEKNLFRLKSIEQKFNKIYEDNYWLDRESRSGTGSNLTSTKSIRYHLPIIFKKFKIKKIFDAPCGDFNWMSKIFPINNIDYLGADIVDNLILINKKKYENNKIRFQKLDIRLNKLPRADLMICRDCLFHFSYDDIFLFLKNFLNSDIKYILLTSHLNDKFKFKNKNILTGDYRLIDFFSKPFNFNKNYIYKFDDRDVNENHINFKQMYLFSRDKFIENIKKTSINKY